MAFSNSSSTNRKQTEKAAAYILAQNNMTTVGKSFKLWLFAMFAFVINVHFFGEIVKYKWNCVGLNQRIPCFEAFKLISRRFWAVTHKYKTLRCI